MRFGILGAGAVGGYYGARLAHAGHDVTFLARGAHLQAIRAHGLAVRSPLGDVVVRAAAETDPSRVGVVDVVIVSVKCYDNQTALPTMRPMVADSTVVLTLQNGVDSAREIAALVGEQAVVGGATYIATAIAEPGVIVQTGTHQRIIVGEVFGERSTVTPRVTRIATALASAGIEVEAVADGWPAIWEKFIYLSPFAGFTGAARQPIGPLWAEPHARAIILDASSEVADIANAEGIQIPVDVRARTVAYVNAIPPSTQSSLLTDLQLGRRIEVEALHGAVVRRGHALGIRTPIIGALYAVLKPYERGAT